MVGKIYFASVGSDGKYNLWVSDGTTAGTVKVNATSVGFAGLAPSNFAALNGQPFFDGFDGAGRPNLFTVDAGAAVEIPTPAGYAPGLSPGSPGQPSIVAFNGKLYFQGRDTAGNYGLFVSDGTGAGTVRLAVPGTSGNFYVSSLTRFGSVLAFAGSPGIGSDLYLSDGTAAGTTKLAVNAPPLTGLNIRSMAVAGGKLVFAGAGSGPNTIVLWSSDGTAAGTMPLAVTGLNPANSYNGGPAGLLSFGTKAAFTATDTLGRSGIWITDGTAAGTIELPGVTGNTYGAPMAALPNGRLAFIATDAAGKKNVFITDGATVTELQVPGASASGLSPNALMVLGNQLLFDGLVTNGPRSLFTSDGTSAGTSLLQTGVTLVAGNIDTDAAVIGPAPSVAAPFTRVLSSTATAVIATAAPGITGDALTVSLLTDAAFPTGSTVSLNAQNQVLYTAGIVTAANAGADAVRFRVTDTITGQITDTTANVALVRFTSPDPLFDVNYYLTHNPDVAAAGVDPYTHYMTFGWHENRDPSATFSTSYYLQQNPDVAAAGVNPLLHFETNGWHEGRNPSASFDLADYLAANPDVRAAGIDPLLHYIANGQIEGRAAFAVPSIASDPLVDAAFVYAARPDVARAGMDATAWFDTYGWKEGANPDAFFNTNYYLSHNSDVAAAHVNPLLHYESNGWTENRDPSAQFSTAKYLAANPDVRAARLDPLLQYVEYGQAEGRATYPV